MSMTFLRFLEQLRFPMLDNLMLFVTQLGTETVFLLIIFILYWCVNKRWAYYLISVGLIGVVCNQTLKLIFQVPRPWILDPGFMAVEQAKAGAGGFSFPSGHTQNAVGTFGGLFLLVKDRYTKIVCLLAAVIIPFSRMYLGVHTPLDVSVSAILAVTLIFALRGVSHEGDLFERILPFLVGIGIAFFGFVQFYPFGNISANIHSGILASFTLLGAVFGFALSYIGDKKFIQFSTDAVWWMQVSKFIGGIGLVFIVKTALKYPLINLFGPELGRFVRYFFVALTAGGVWPFLFTKLIKNKPGVEF